MKWYITTMLLFLGGTNYLWSQVTVGDVTNYTKIEDDGTLEFIGNGTVWDDYVIPLSTAKAKGTDPPAFEKFLDNGASSIGVWAYTFANNKGDEVSFTIQMPHSWAGTAIHPHVHWSPGDNTSGDVVWGIEYTWIEYNPTTPNTFPATIIETTTETVTGSDHKHLITGFSFITPSSVQDGISSIIVMRLFRDGTNSLDTYNDAAFGLSFDIHSLMGTKN